MSPHDVKFGDVDEWLSDDSDTAALVLRQYLVSVEGSDAVVFPPTYAIQDSATGYNVDYFDDGFSVCQIDSVGSQANRIEPMFGRAKYKHLVPQVVVNAGDRHFSLLEVGHRAADAMVRYSELESTFVEAFEAIRDRGDALPMAKIAPTSLVFGVWDSRATQVKLPRIVRSVIRANNVRVLTRSAQYGTKAGEILAGDGEVEVTTKGPKAKLGLAHVPATGTHGGVQVIGEIRREAVLNLAPLCALAALPDGADEDTDGSATTALRRYILGLALVSFTAQPESALREGCVLVPDPDRPGKCERVTHDGTHESFDLSHEDALAYATAGAEAFGVGLDLSGDFERDRAQRALEEESKKKEKAK